LKKDAYYFPHFSNARTDRRLKRVRKQLGIEGYGIYFMLLETLREQTGFKYPVEDIDLLADEFGTSEEKARAVVSNFGLFEIDENEEFFSPKMLEYLEPYLENKERKRLGGIKGNLLRYNKITKEKLETMTDKEIIDYDKQSKSRSFSLCDSESESVTDHSSSQSKVKESKVKESKVKQSKVKDIYNDDFEHFWSEWKRNIKNDSNKKSSCVSFNKLSDKDKMDLFESIHDYGKSNKDHQYLKRCETYINQRHWEQRVSFLPKVRAMGDF
jgi:hypothetical protein